MDVENRKTLAQKVSGYMKTNLKTVNSHLSKIGMYETEKEIETAKCNYTRECIIKSISIYIKELQKQSLPLIKKDLCSLLDEIISHYTYCLEHKIPLYKN